jgi:hypothetical protein
VRLGERSTRIRSGGRIELIRYSIPLLAVVCAMSVAADAQATVGPGRIVCNAAFCELGSGARPNERVRVIVSNLPQDEIRRLRKCTGVAKPCIVTIEGAEQGSPTRIMASDIHWQE